MQRPFRYRVLNAVKQRPTSASQLSNWLDLSATWAKNALILLPLAYALGFVIINFVYGLWGFSDLSTSDVQCLIAAFEVLALALLACLALDVIYRILEWSNTLASPTKNTVRFALHSIWIAPLLCLVLFFVWQIRWPASFNSFVDSHRFAVNEHRLALFGWWLFVTAIAGFIAFVGWFRNRHLTDRPLSWTERISIVLTCLFSVACLVLVYALIPTRFGGVRPEMKDLWVTSEALPMLRDCSEDAKQSLAGNHSTSALTLVHGLYVLHESSDFLELWSASCPDIVQVPKGQIKGKQWKDPQR